MNPREIDQLLSELIRIAEIAGAAIMEIYASPFAVSSKKDNSPLTEADQRSEDLILARLPGLLRGVPAIGEESYSAATVPRPLHTFWLVDPLDGTKEFVARNGEFTVNIGLVTEGEPALGVIIAPAHGVVYSGARGLGAFVRRAGESRQIKCRRPGDSPVVVESRSHAHQATPPDTWLKGRRIAQHVQMGSALKFCVIAEGKADIYPRRGRTMEWDTCAGQAILEAAGGTVCDLDGMRLSYGKEEFANPHFIASGAWD